jgi:hypothetical protein
MFPLAYFATRFYPARYWVKAGVVVLMGYLARVSADQVSMLKIGRDMAEALTLAGGAVVACWLERVSLAERGSGDSREGPRAVILETGAVAVGDVVRVSGGSYEVAGVAPDGFGFALVVLEGPL